MIKNAITNCANLMEETANNVHLDVICIWLMMEPAINNAITSSVIEMEMTVNVHAHILD